MHLIKYDHNATYELGLISFFLKSCHFSQGQNSRLTCETAVLIYGVLRYFGKTKPNFMFISFLFHNITYTHLLLVHFNLPLLLLIYTNTVQKTQLYYNNKVYAGGVLSSFLLLKVYSRD